MERENGCRLIHKTHNSFHPTSDFNPAGGCNRKIKAASSTANTEAGQR